MEFKIISVLGWPHINPAHGTFLLVVRLDFTVSLEVGFLHFSFLFKRNNYHYDRIMSIICWLLRCKESQTFIQQLCRAGYLIYTVFSFFFSSPLSQGNISVLRRTTSWCWDGQVPEWAHGLGLVWESCGSKKGRAQLIGYVHSFINLFSTDWAHAIC